MVIPSDRRDQLASKGRSDCCSDTAVAIAYVCFVSGIVHRLIVANSTSPEH